jgi:hypothetical protein
MGMGRLDEVKVVRLIPDEQQLAEIEFNEAQEAFCAATCRFHDTKQQDAMEVMTEAEVRLLNAFMNGSDNPVMLKAWAAYRRRLMFRDRQDSRLN